MATDEQFLKLFSKTGFISPRANQKETILKTLAAYESGKKYVIINAPVGFGKSATSYTVAQYFSTTFFLTHQKILQEQYLKDFGMPWVASSENYKCKLIEGCSCKQCLKASFNAPRCKNCAYALAKQSAFSSDQCSLNYAFMFAMTGALRDAFEKRAREFVVCDEAHVLADELIARGTIEIKAGMHFKMQNSYPSSIQLGIPDFSHMSDEKALTWVLTTYREYVCQKKNEIAAQLEQFLDPRQIPKRLRSRFRNLTAADMFFTQHKCQISDLCAFALKSIDDVVIIKSEDSVTIKPLSARGLFYPLLGRFGKKFLFMSGTILDKDHFCADLGISPDDCEYISLDSDFPVENRKIFYWPSGSLVYSEKQKTIPKMVQEISKLLSKYPNVKGIIHTANYEIAKAIQDDLRFSENFNRLLFINAKDKIEQLKQFEQSSEPLVLVSPSLSEGLDLKDDLSRLCIICKVPYASLGDLWVKRKLAIDPKWYKLKTAETMVQQTGRSVRSNKDYADTYILDSEFVNFYSKNVKIFPKWWKDSIVWV